MSAASATAVKPLPKLPLAQSSNDIIRAELPPAARDHVRRIIAQCVADESSSGLETSCIPLIHQAVEDISKAIHDGHWLDGLLALKDMRRKRTLLLDGISTESPTSPNTSNEPSDGRETPKHRYHHLGLSNSFVSPGNLTASSPRRLRTPKLRGQELAESNARAMTELQRLISPETQSSASPTMEMLHLVITLTTPDIDIFMAHPTKLRCSFVKHRFTLPDDTSSSKTEKVVDVVGVESWKCTLPNFFLIKIMLGLLLYL